MLSFKQLEHMHGLKTVLKERKYSRGQFWVHILADFSEFYQQLYT